MKKQRTRRVSANELPLMVWWSMLRPRIEKRCARALYEETKYDARKPGEKR